MKKLLIPFLILSLLTVLQGCGSQKVWVNPQSDLSQAQRDFAHCELYAETSVAPINTSNNNQQVWNTNCRNGSYGSTDCTTTQGHQNKTAAESIGEGLGAGFARGMQLGKIKKLCMQSKGYNLVDKNPNAPKLSNKIKKWYKAAKLKTIKEDPSQREVPDGIEEGSPEHAMWLNGIEGDMKAQLSVREEVLLSWIRKPVSTLKNHLLFSKMMVTKKTAPDDTEIWSYINGTKNNGCDNIFHVKNEVVLRYTPKDYGIGTCSVDSSMKSKL